MKDRTSDLSPPLGYPGGPCHVVQRIHEEVGSPRLEEKLIGQVERNKGLTNTDAGKVYDVETEAGTTHGIRKILISPHAQYRMDLRGVTVPEVRLALKNFVKQLNDWKSQQDSRYNSTVEDIARGEGVRWEDPKLKLVVVFTGHGRETVRIVTAFWKGVPDERAPGPGQCSINAGYQPPAGDLGSYRTFVKFPDGDHAPDREKEQPLPTPPWKRQKPFGKPEYNTPGWSGQGPQEKSINKDLMRTKGLPGEYSPPNDEPSRITPKRRSIEGADADIEASWGEVLAYKPKGPLRVKIRQKPVKRQRKQRGRAKMYSRRYYKKNRAKARLRGKLRYRKLRRLPTYKRMQKIRRKNPQRFKRRPGGGRTSPGQRLAYVLTAPDIAFVIGRDMTLGYVHNVSPLTGMVTYYLTDRDGNFAALRSMVVPDFLAAVGFLSEEDVNAMFRLVDAELGVEAYEELSEAGLRASMDIEGVDCDDPEFESICEQLTGKRELGDMTGDEMSEVEGYFISRVVYDDPPEFPHEDRLVSPADPYLTDPTDDDFIYGVVYLPEEWRESVERLACHYAEMLYEKYPVEHEPGTWYDRAGPDTLIQKMYEDRERAEAEPLAPVEPDNPGSAKVIPYDSDLVNNKAAARIAEIRDGCSANLHRKSRGLPIRLKRSDTKNRLWLFDVKGSSGTYRVKVKAVAQANIVDPKKADVQVTCSCPFWQWQGPEYWASKRGYLYGRPRGTATRPDQKDPHGKHGACKHVLAVLDRVSSFMMKKQPARRFASLVPLAEMLATGRITISSSGRAALQRVVRRYLEGGGGHADL